MPVALDGDTIRVSGRCPVQDAEPLQTFLQSAPTAAVDLSGCSHLHTSIVQVLRCARPAIASMPDAPSLRALLAAVLHPDRATPIADDSRG